MKYETIIFDFDGTIVDTAKGIVSANKKTLKKLGLIVPDDSVISEKIGMTLERTLIALGVAPTELERAVSIYREMYYELIFKETKLFPEVKETLNIIKDKGFPVTIATNRSKKGLDTLIEYFKFNNFFSVVLSRDDVTNPKPDTEMANKILKKLNILPEKALVVGDTVNDVFMGNNAGCDTCLVSYGYGNKKELSKTNPTYEINSFAELLTII